ncbi:hypothetical protein [Planktothrix pseudagardhii]|uniref:Uncharacterized protein n=1 Tax=Planktothrix pseudagardhii TaxID=132604 RepID=A0A9W4CRV5_9CYAN|nr:hypothetical protein [Planktothrix pseudagardhii]CAD5955991.1 hypothetical protein NO713_02883 [Planktothrix pseudagardhii]
MDVVKVLSLKNQLINIVEKIQLSLSSSELDSSNILQFIQEIKPDLKTINTKINDEKRNHSVFGALDQLSFMDANQDTAKQEKIQYAKRLDLMNQIAIDSGLLLNLVELLEYYFDSEQYPVIKNALCYLVDIILIELNNWTDENDSREFIEKYDWSRLIDSLMQFEQSLNLTSANPLITQSEININSIFAHLQTYRLRLNEQYEQLIQTSLELQRQQEAELQRQQELELQRQQELELQRQQEEELQRQRELELQRQQELELQRQQELELQRQQELELQRQQELELQRQQESELQRQQELELQRQQELELQRQQESELQRQQESELQRQQKAELKRQQEAELKRQRELELQRQQQEELQRQQEAELQRQRELELQRQQQEELQRQREEELQRQRELELQRQQELELKRQQELELQRQQELELQRQQELELQRQQEEELQRQQQEELRHQREAELKQKKEKEIRQLMIIVAAVILLGGLGLLIFNPFKSKQENPNILASETPQSRLDTAEKLAVEASKLIENPPHPLTVWQQAQTQLQDAIQLLEAIPKNYSDSEKINQKLQIYQKDYNSISQILNKEQKATNDLESAKKLAMEASVMLQNPPESLSVWQESEQKWKQSINLLESIPKDSFIYPESQDRLKIYRTNHEAVAQKNQQKNQ